MAKWNGLIDLLSVKGEKNEALENNIDFIYWDLSDNSQLWDTSANERKKEGIGARHCLLHKAAQAGRRIRSKPDYRRFLV